MKRIFIALALYLLSLPAFAEIAKTSDSISAPVKAMLLCPHRVLPTDETNLNLMRNEDNYNAKEAQEALQFLSDHAEPNYQDDLQVNDNWNILEGYQLKLDAQYKRFPDSVDKFCKWIEKRGFAKD